MNSTRIVIHNTVNDASAMAEISYMIGNNYERSFHFAVDDTRAVQGIELNRNAWHCGDGNGKGNREGIAIEICYSKSGGERFAKSQDNAAALTATLLKQYGWGIDRVTKHQDYTNKNCPHRTLSDYGWPYFLDRVTFYLNEIQKETTPVSNPAPAVTAPQPVATPAPKIVIPDVIYAAYTTNWLPSVTNYNEKNDNGYAGLPGKSISGIRMRLSKGDIIYRVHTIGGKYLPWVRNQEQSQGGYAGTKGKPIDMVQIYLENAPGCSVEYRVATLKGKYLPWVRNYNSTSNGYAGITGKKIDKIQIRIVKS